VDLLVVISALLRLLLRRPTPQRLLYIHLGVLAANHESDLARGICRDSGETVLSDGEDFTARLLDILDQVKMEPLVLGYEGRGDYR